MNADKANFAQDVVMTAAQLERQYWQAKKLIQRLNAKQYNDGAANEFTDAGVVQDGDLPAPDIGGLGHVSPAQLYAAINAATAFVAAMESAGNLGALTAISTGTIKAR